MPIGLEDNYFRTHSPAQIIAKVAEYTLATISKWAPAELERVGWTEDNIVIAKLYTLTSTGVWISRVTTAGKQKVDDSDVSDNVILNKLTHWGDMRPTVNGSYLASTDIAQKAMRELATVTFVSNAGGSIDTDPELVPALAGYFGVCRIISIRGTSAETPIFEVQEGATAIEGNISPGTLVANVQKALDENYLWGGTDDSAISLDGSGCSALGNAVSYTMVIEYWYET